MDFWLETNQNKKIILGGIFDTEPVVATVTITCKADVTCTAVFPSHTALTYGPQPNERENTYQRRKVQQRYQEVNSVMSSVLLPEQD